MAAEDMPAPLRDPLIARPRRLIAEYAFSLGRIPESVRVRIYHNLDDGHYEYDQSHFIQTPLQTDPEVGEITDHGSAETALAEAVGTMIKHYRAAVAAGHEPGIEWLLPNDVFM